MKNPLEDATEMLLSFENGKLCCAGWILPCEGQAGIRRFYREQAGLEIRRLPADDAKKIINEHWKQPK